MSSRKLVATVVTAASAVTVLASCGAAPVHDTKVSDLAGDDTAAASVEEVAARLAPRFTPEGAAAWRSLCDNGENDIGDALPQGIPEYLGGLLTGSGEAEMSVRVWILPSASDASREAAELTAGLAECPSTVEFGAGAAGQADVTFAETAPDGWQGGRQTQVGLYGTDTDTNLSGITNHTVLAERGVMLAQVTWQRVADKADNRLPPQVWQHEAGIAVAEVLSALGGDPKQPAPTEPDGKALSNRLAKPFPEPSFYHPDATPLDDRDQYAEDLFCSDLPWAEDSLPTAGTWFRQREVVAQVPITSYADMESEQDEAGEPVSPPVEAVSVHQAIAVSADVSSASKLTEKWRGDRSGDPEKPSLAAPKTLCDQWWLEKNPRAGEAVEEWQATTVDYAEDGWSGTLESFGARYESAGPEATVHESAVHVSAIVHRGPLSVYLRCQTGAGDDLAAAMDEALAAVDDSLAVIPD